MNPRGALNDISHDISVIRIADWKWRKQAWSLSSFENYFAQWSGCYHNKFPFCLLCSCNVASHVYLNWFKKIVSCMFINQLKYLLHLYRSDVQQKTTVLVMKTFSKSYFHIHSLLIATHLGSVSVCELIGSALHAAMFVFRCWQTSSQIPPYICILN